MKLQPVLALLLVTGLVACQGVREQEATAPEIQRAITTESLEPFQCGTIPRVHTIDGVFTAGQPKAADFELARLAGFRTVLNFRTDEEEPALDERAIVEDLGLIYVHQPWNGPDELTDEVFVAARKALQSAERPLMVHCGSANRVGAIWIPWRVLDGGLDLEAAVAEAKLVGLKTPAYEELARDYVKRHMR